MPCLAKTTSPMAIPVQNHWMLVLCPLAGALICVFSFRKRGVWCCRWRKLSCSAKTMSPTADSCVDLLDSCALSTSKCTCLQVDAKMLLDNNKFPPLPSMKPPLQKKRLWSQRWLKSGFSSRSLLQKSWLEHVTEKNSSPTTDTKCEIKSEELSVDDSELLSNGDNYDSIKDIYKEDNDETWLPSVTSFHSD